MLTSLHRAVALFALSVMTISTAAAQESTYVVKRGDSFSSIAASQLNNAGRWREIWSLNPQVRRPTQLQAGMRLQLPTATAPAAARMTTTTPERTTLGTTPPDGTKIMALDLIHSGHIRTLNADYRLLDNSQLPQLPRIHAERNEADGQYLYAHQLDVHAATGQTYGLFLRSPEPAGATFTELTRVGKAVLVMRDGNKGRLKITENRRGDLSDVLLLPMATRSARLTPEYPQTGVETRILKALYEQPGGYLLILDQGSQAGLQPGHLLNVFKRNPIENDTGQILELTAINAARVMIIDTSRDASLALVLSAQRVPAVGDRVR
ncbi:MAG: LysM peptidoglycan-binding domain-containing protein [Oceanospirillales bacterium]|nr:LysM peptidoglycan-binding domain-containing protein [Oceanospirillales bacterium]